LVTDGLRITNLFTKQVATVSGITFSLVFFEIFSLSERTTQQRHAYLAAF